MSKTQLAFLYHLFGHFVETWIGCLHLKYPSFKKYFCEGTRLGLVWNRSLFVILRMWKSIHQVKLSLVSFLLNHCLRQNMCEVFYDNWIWMILNMKSGYHPLWIILTLCLIVFRPLCFTISHCRGSLSRSGGIKNILLGWQSSRDPEMSKTCHIGLFIVPASVLLMHTLDLILIKVGVSSVQYLF